jgi:hypothetical protein
MLQQYTSAVASAISIGSLVFFAGRESNRLDELITKVHAAEVERKDIKDVIYDIHGRVCSIENDVKHIAEK